MLYQLYETQRALMAPFAEFASASAKLYNHPLSPFTHTPMAQRIAAGFDLLHRLAKHPLRHYHTRSRGDRHKVVERHFLRISMSKCGDTEI